MIVHFDALVFAVYLHDLLARSHFEAVTLGEELRSSHQQLAAFGDFVADVIGQSAIGKRDILILFKQNDLGLLIHPPRPRGRRSPTSYSTDNHNFQRSF